LPDNTGGQDFAAGSGSDKEPFSASGNLKRRQRGSDSEKEELFQP
jgi:hypothetical protein